MSDGQKKKKRRDEAGVQYSYYDGFFSENHDEEEYLTWENTVCADYLTSAFLCSRCL